VRLATISLKNPYILKENFHGTSLAKIGTPIAFLTMTKIGKK